MAQSAIRNSQSAIVLILSGGGAKTFAHAGAWRALAERGLTPKHVVATSMGAVIGAALIANGWRAVAAAAQGLKRSDIATLDPLGIVKGVYGKSLLKASGLARAIARMVPARRFDELQIPLTVTATDLDTGALTLFGALGASDVPLQDALYASCALPLYFPAAEIAGRRYGDGGLRSVLPLAVARRVPADRYVAVDVGPGFDEVMPAGGPSRVPALVRAHGEAERIMMAAQVEREIAEWPRESGRLVVVRAVAEKEATFRVEEAERYVRAGYEATRAALSPGRKSDS